MLQVNRALDRRHSVLLGIMVVAWASLRYRTWRRRQWLRVSDLKNEQLLSRYQEVVDAELGTGLFI
jgi:hypothetical protein